MVSPNAVGPIVNPARKPAIATPEARPVSPTLTSLITPIITNSAQWEAASPATGRKAAKTRATRRLVVTAIRGSAPAAK